MPFPIRVRPQVEADIRAAMVWYGERVPGLDRAFHRAVLDALDRLCESPEMYRVIQGDVRRVILRRFPYALFYLFDGTEVVVLACIHERRSPEQWPGSV
jgi:plasmid stabilization system protein ParE